MFCPCNLQLKKVLCSRFPSAVDSANSNAKIVVYEFCEQHYKSIMQYINQGPLFLSVQMHQPDRTTHAYMDALQAFWPGLQVSFELFNFATFLLNAHILVFTCSPITR